MKVTFVKVLLLCVWCFYLRFYCVLSCLSCLLLHPVLLCFLSSVCMLYVYGCFGEINYDRHVGTGKPSLNLSK